MKPWVDRPLRASCSVIWLFLQVSGEDVSGTERGPSVLGKLCTFSVHFCLSFYGSENLSIEEGVKVTKSPSQVGCLGQSWSLFCLFLSILGTTSVLRTLLCCHAWRNSWQTVGLHPPGIVHSGFCHFSSKDLAMPPQHSQVERLYLLTASHHFGFIFISTNHNLKDCPIALVMKSLPL